MEAGYAAAGLLVGFLVGLTGVGGGSLMAPLLILAFGFHPAVAVGTDLWFAAITKSVGGAIHGRLGTTDWVIVRRLALGSVPAAIAVLLWLDSRDSGLEVGFLTRLLGGALLLTSLLLPLKGRLHAPLIRLRHKLGPQMRGHQVALTLIGGCIVGALVTLTSVGAGALVAVLLMFLYPLRLSARALVGTDIVHAIPLTLVAAIGHSWLGNVDWTLLLRLLLGSIPGIVLGSLLTHRVNEGLVRTCLAVMLFLSGIKLLLA